MNRFKQIHVVWLSGSLLFIAFLLHWYDAQTLKNIALITAAVVAGWSTTKRALQTVMMKSFSIELLVTIAVVGALIIGEYVEAAAVTFLFLFGAYLEVRSLEKTRTSLQTLLDMAPQEATVWKNGERILLPIEEIKAGDLILIQSGEKIAIDGKVISGKAQINEAAITGESVPATKRENETVFSGTIVDNGYIEVIAEKVGDDTTFAKIIELVEEAQEGKARTQKFLERFANVYTPGIILLSFLVFLLSRNIELSLTFLVIACPGALVISAPVSLVAGIGNGARHGILIKGGEIMENFAKVDVVVFDKTGTLTEGNPSVTNVKAYGIEEEKLLKITAEAELISEHHLGRTIVEEVKTRNIELTNEPTAFTIEKGYGLYATVGNDKVVIGNRKLLLKNQIELADVIHEDAVQLEKAGNTVVFVAANRKAIGIIAIADQIRSEAAETISQLKEAGVKETVMLTGDNEHTAMKVAAQLDIGTVFSEMLPEDKVKHIERLQEEGYSVAMVGDGVNDAPAIALADVGIAMGAAGTDTAMETADVVLMGDRLDRIVYAMALSKVTVRNMLQNMFFAVGTVAFLLVGVLLGKVFLASGMLIHELSVLAVIVNALRLITFKKSARTVRSPLAKTQKA